MKLSEIMSPSSVYFSPTDSVLSVAESMAAKHHSCGLICDFEKPVGIVTERDIVRLFAAEGDTNTLQDASISEYMTRDPICIEADTELPEALDLAQSRNLRHLPVVDSTQKLIGIITMTDMVKAYLATVEKNKDLVNENQKLHYLSIEDPLTGLPNRRAMEIDVRHAAAIAQRRSEHYSLAIIDVDYFKKYNDHYGHQSGDDALKHIANTLRETKREADKLFRYGGEEFLLLMPYTGSEGAMIATQRMCKAISDTRYNHSESSLGYLTVSIGFASSTSDYWETVIEHADTALYDAKERGRNMVCMVEQPADSDFWDLGKSAENSRPAAN